MPPPDFKYLKAETGDNLKLVRGEVESVPLVPTLEGVTPMTEPLREESRTARGPKKPTQEEKDRRVQLAADWVQFKTAKAGTKKDFCRIKKISVKAFNCILAILRKPKNGNRGAN